MVPYKRWKDHWKISQSNMAYTAGCNTSSREIILSFSFLQTVFKLYVLIRRTDLEAIHYLLRCLFCQVLQTWTWGESLTVIRNWETSWLLLDPSSNLVVHFFFIFQPTKKQHYHIVFTLRIGCTPSIKAHLQI